MSELKSKRERILFLLDHYTDFHETLHQADEHGDGDGAITLMPRMFHHPSVKELRRSIRQARVVEAVGVAHMLALYTAEWRTTDQLIKRRTRKGRFELVKVRVRQRVLPRWLSSVAASRGVDAVVEAFAGEVFIPSELLEAA